MSLIDTFVADMQFLHDATPVGMNPEHQKAHRAVISQGHLLSHRSATLDWLDGIYPELRDIYVANPWTKIRGWIVVNRSPGTNRFANAWIAIRNFEVWALRQSTMTWVRIGLSNPNDGNYYDDDVIHTRGPAIRRTVIDVTEFKPSENAGWNNIHIYGPTAQGISYGADIIGLHARVQARLVLGDSGQADNRSTALQLFGCGIDLYPTDAAEVNNGGFAPIDWGPGACGGRMRFLSADWQTFSATTVRPNGDPNPNMPVVDTWRIPASVAERSMTETFFRANPPPTDDVPEQPDTPVLLLPGSAQVGSVVRARFLSAGGSPISGAAVSWQGAPGGVIYGGTTNDQGAVTVRLTTIGGFSLAASGGGVSASASVTVQSVSSPNVIADSESPSGWNLTGSSPSPGMATGEDDVYGGTRWGLFTQGGPSGGDPSAISHVVPGLLTSGRISGSWIVERGNQDWVVLAVIGSDSPHASARAWFNIATGQRGGAEALGAGSNQVADIEPWGDGKYRISLSVDVSAGGGDSMLLLRVDSGNQAFSFPAGATVIVGAAMLNVGGRQEHLPTDLDVAVAINPKTLAMAQTGQPYGETITCAGVPPITWSISSGSLPTGISADTGQTSTTLTLSATNVTATTASTFTVSATDGTTSDNESFTIPVGTTAGDPTGLTANAVNSDTIHLEWTPNAVATETVIQIRHATEEGWSAWSSVASINPASTEHDVSGLLLGTAHEVRVFQRTASGPTGYSNVASVTTRRLYVEAYASVSALGQEGVDVQVFRPAPAGRALPLGDLIAYVPGVTFGPAAVVVGGIQQAPIRVELVEQTDPPLRNGDRVSAIVTLDSPRRTTQPTSNAKVIEA